MAEWWRDSGDREVLILLGPAEAEEGEYWRRYGHVETSLELPQVASILTRATCYIGNDSGVSHLAGVVGAQGVVIFGPTRPEQWRPLGGGATGHQGYPLPREMAGSRGDFSGRSNARASLGETDYGAWMCPLSVKACENTL